MRKFLTTLGLILTARPLFASGEMYHQNYNPLGNVALSTIVAAVPIVAGTGVMIAARAVKAADART